MPSVIGKPSMMIQFIKIALTIVIFTSCNNNNNSPSLTKDTINSANNMTETKDSANSNIQLNEKYIKLANQGEWQKALPIIEAIVQQNIKLSTSWFNYGVCLDGLNQYNKASKAFMTAYELDPKDYGAQYRIYRSLTLANDTNEFIIFLNKDIKVVPEISDLLLENSEFKSMTSNSVIKKILNKSH